LREQELVRFHEKEPFSIGEFIIDPFSTHHRMGCVTASMGFCIIWRGKKIGYITDCGMIDDTIVRAMRGSHAAIIEANHQIEMVKNGPRPWMVKKWILSDTGHLSNTSAADLINRLSRAQDTLRHVLLAHVSEAHNVLEDLVGEVAKLLDGDTVKLSVTYHHAPSEIIEMEEGLR
jgi:phosphoribosyl 1,2-cyclic phosphodiesterase